MKPRLCFLIISMITCFAFLMREDETIPVTQAAPLTSVVERSYPTTLLVSEKLMWPVPARTCKSPFYQVLISATPFRSTDPAKNCTHLELFNLNKGEMESALVFEIVSPPAGALFKTTADGMETVRGTTRRSLLDYYKRLAHE